MPMVREMAAGLGGCGSLLMGLALLLVPADAWSATKPVAPSNAPALAAPVPWTGDFDKMKERRIIRILVPFSKTLYFHDKGAERGKVAELGRAFETWLNAKYKTGALKINVDFIPTSRDRLLPALVEGLGDIAAGDLTVTPERLQTVDFAKPNIVNVKEIIVSGPSAPKFASLDDLAGREIHVRTSSSYWRNLTALNEQFKAKNLKAITLVPAEEDLGDEDILEMVNAGLLSYTVVDDHAAKFWAKVFTHLTAHEDLAVASGEQIAWAVRKNSPLLVAEINEFTASHGVGSAFMNEVMRKYYTNTKILQNAYSPERQAEFQKLIEYFRKHGATYDFDHLMIAAQGFQESRLDQSVRSPKGAVGIMQVLPSTAADPSIGIPDVEKNPDRNIEAGSKYLRRLIDVYLNDPKIDPKNRALMAFAADNAGPGNLKRFRTWAEESGLDPNVWFYNVEASAARIVGQETVQYVSNIYKYYVAYRLLTDLESEEEKAKATAK